MRTLVIVVVLGGCRFGFDPLETGVSPDADGDTAATTRVNASTTGTGTGRIIGTVNTVVLDCASCTQSFAPGTTIQFSAAADPGSWFRGWTGGCAGRRTCDLPIGDVDVTITADFTPEPNRIFISSITHDAQLLTAGAGDMFCAQLATAAGLAGTYKVLVSTAATGPMGWPARAVGARGWIRVDGQPVADAATDLGAGAMFAALTVTETGAPVDPGGEFWAMHRNTGATTFCQDWTTNSAAQASFAITNQRGSNYGNGGGQRPCNTPAHVICAGADRNVVVQPVTDPGRKAFTTIAFWDTTTGLATADALCASEAATAGRTESFRALLAMPGASALSRFDLTKEPWSRVDGLPLLSTTAAWATAAAFDASANLDASGANVNYSQIITGAADPGAPGTQASTCNGWTAMTSSGAPMFTWETRLRLAAGTGGCGMTLSRLICLEQ